MVKHIDNAANSYVLVLHIDSVIIAVQQQRYSRKLLLN